MKFWTVGYEGQEIQDFVTFLKKKRIRHVADVRKNPVSRKKGFSKSRLAQALDESGISYSHHPRLGVPSAWRKAAKAGKISRQQMFKNYVSHILKKEDEEIKSLQQILHQSKLALLCYEADALDCHRLFVAQEILRREKRAKHPAEVIHLRKK